MWKTYHERRCSSDNYGFSVSMLVYPGVILCHYPYWHQWSMAQGRSWRCWRRYVPEALEVGWPTRWSFVTFCYWKWPMIPCSSLIYVLKMVIFHSYVTMLVYQRVDCHSLKWSKKETTYPISLLVNRLFPAKYGSSKSLMNQWFQAPTLTHQ